MPTQEEAPLLRPSQPAPNRTLFLLPAIAIFVLYALFVLQHPSPPYTILRHHMGGGKPHGHDKDCDAKDFKETTLKGLFDIPLVNLLPEGLPIYEASAIAIDKVQSAAYVLFENTYAIARLTRPGPFRPSPQLMRWPGDIGEKSRFKFLAYNSTSRTYVVGRQTKDENGQYRTRIYDVRLGDNIQVLGSCLTEFEFGTEDKGFGGGVMINVNGQSLLLGVCERNFCHSGDKGHKAGNGRLVVMRRVRRGRECVFETVQIVELPPAANFEDYSAIATWGDSLVAITSQKNAAMLLGELTMKGEKISIENEMVIDFPRNDQCEIKYCNIKGIAFADDRTVFAVSDAMKGNGKQSFRCREKDQSIHMFSLP